MTDPLFNTYVALAIALAVAVIYGLTRLVRRNPRVGAPEDAPAVDSDAPVALQQAQLQAQQLQQLQQQYQYYDGATARTAPNESLIERCICGRPATAVAPRIERGRGTYDWFREVFALPPRYKRVVPITGRKTLCDSHAHVADSLVEEFIHVRVRGMLTEAYRRIATEAAGFEQEVLLKQLADSLTDEQKRERKREAQRMTVVSLPPRTGSDE